MADYHGRFVLLCSDYFYLGMAIVRTHRSILLKHLLNIDGAGVGTLVNTAYTLF